MINSYQFRSSKIGPEGSIRFHKVEKSIFRAPTQTFPDRFTYVLYNIETLKHILLKISSMGIRLSILSGFFSHYL